MYIKITGVKISIHKPKNQFINQLSLAMLPAVGVVPLQQVPQVRPRSEANLKKAAQVALYTLGYLLVKLLSKSVQPCQRLPKLTDRQTDKNFYNEFLF